MFFQQTSFAADTDVSAQFQSAEKLFEAALYDRAIPLYSQIKQNNEATYRLAQCYFLSGKYAEVTSLLQESPENQRLLFLSALSHYKMKNYETAALFFEKYLEILDNQEFRNEATLELGKTYFFLGKFPEAMTLLTKTKSQEPIVTLYKARCLLAQNKPDEAETLLSKQEFSALDPLHFEAAYLRGEAAFQKEDFTTSARFFEQALPQNVPENMSWYREALYHLALCYLAAKDPEAFHKAEALFSHQGIFVSQEARTQALLLLAEAAPTYSQRDTLYRHLTQDENCDSKGWYLRGINDLNEGKKLLNEHQDQEARKALERAVSSLQKVDTPFFEAALKHQIHALILQENHRQAIEKLNEFKHVLSEDEEIPYLYALAASKLPEDEGASIIENSLKLARGEFVDDVLNIIGTLYFRKQDYQKAESIFLRLSKEFPESPFTGDALYWIARCAENRQDFETAKDFKKQTFEKYPKCNFAPEAYFTYYTYRDYLHGDRAAIKHLEAFAEKYPESPFLIQAWYLIGLDYERDRKTIAGKWIRKKNLMAAIDAFQEAEVIFDTLYSQGLLPKQDLEFLTLIRYRTILERALANMTISDTAQGAKRLIYLEYAEEVLRRIIEDCRNLDHPLQPYMARIKSHGKIEDESTYWLAQSCIKSSNDAEAEKILGEMLEKYRLAKISRGYFLSRCWYDKGLIAFRAHNPTLSLELLQRSEDAAKGNVLSTEEKLDLWIHQSLCHQELRDLDSAILILSKVINDDSISSLRVKAMLLRAEAYELQGRRELARKQLEATAKKGGEWAVKAKEKLDKQYGYQ